jgi:hypothetical protein
MLEIHIDLSPFSNNSTFCLFSKSCKSWFSQGMFAVSNILSTSDLAGPKISFVMLSNLHKHQNLHVSAHKSRAIPCLIEEDPRMRNLLGQYNKLPTKLVQDCKPSHCDESIFPVLICLVFDLTSVIAIRAQVLPLYSLVNNTHATIVGHIVDYFRVIVRVLDPEVSKGGG